MKNVLLIFAALLMLFAGCNQTTTTIENIRNNHDDYNHERVVIEGIAQRYVEGTSTTSSYYELRGDFAAPIRVNTSGSEPEIGKRYRVTGTVTISDRQPLIIESGRTMVGNDGLFQIIIIVALFIIAGLIVFILTRQKKVSTKKDPGISGNGKNPPPPPDPKEYYTIKVESDPPPTMKRIGEMLILTGSDNGKTIILKGYPTTEGYIATLGRDHTGWEKLVPGNRKFAHVRIKDNSQTLSRLQAEIIYTNGNVYLKNLGTTNPTMVDGYEVQVNEMVDIKPDSTIKAGYMEFRYLNSD